MKLAILRMTAGLAVGTFLVMVFSAACNPIIKVDVSCEKLCISAPGPTLPGITSIDAGEYDGGTYAVDASENTDVDSFALDAALPAAADVDTVEWIAVVEFNQVLKEMPQGSVADQTKVLLTAISLSSSQSLEFVDAVDVSISRHLTPSATDPARDSRQDGSALVASPTSTVVCAAVGARLLVAHFQRLAETASETQLPLELLAPELNIFDCMKDDPTEFQVKMAFRPGQHPIKDTPLLLSPCIRSETHLGIP